MTETSTPGRGGQPRRGIRRRPLLAAVTSGAAAVTGITVAARLGTGPDDGGSDGRLQLAGDGGMGVQSLDLPLDRDALTEVAPGRWESGRLLTSTHSMVAFTWPQGAPEPQIAISSRVAGAWQPWQPVPHAHGAVASGDAEGPSTVGTELAWVGRAEGIRVRVAGARPEGLTLVLLHPTPLPGDATDAAPAERRTTMRTSADAADSDRAPRPPIRSRRDWGADPRLRDGRPQYVDTIRQVHVHHTANSNDYGRDDVPAMIRGMYAYHTQSLGWSDIGYNFLVDRFGRIWVGRGGGAARPVRGAHTLGFNHNSAGVAAIGNFDTASPPDALIGGIARVTAWKLDMYGRDPLARTTVTSEGSDKYRAGRRVTLPVVDGHRDTNDTACPGRHLYDALPRVRRRARRIIERARQRDAEITEPFSGDGTAVAGRSLVVRPGAWTPSDARPSYQWMRDGAAVTGATGRRYQLGPGDVGSRMSARVTVGGPDIRPTTQTVDFPDRVKAQPELAVRAAGRRGKALVEVHATAPGLDGPVTGSVTVTLADRTHELQLVDGRGTTLFRKVAPGDYRVEARYAGNREAAPATGADPVTVKPRR